MTTFTTEDRIIAEKNGSVTINVEPIPFAGMITLTETAPKSEPVAWMVDGVLFTSLGAALNISFDIEQPCIPLYTHPAKAQEK
jgi:hypothetical protein